MKKDIYLEVPENFHGRYMDTIASLENEREEANEESGRRGHNKRYSFKRTVVLIAAVVGLLSSLTAGAVSIYRWHQAAREQLGVSGELAGKMSVQGAAKEESAAVSEDAVTIKALQSVKTDNFYYVLLSVTTPESVTINEDTVFEGIEVVSEGEFTGSTIDYITDSFEGQESLWEVKLLTADKADYAGVEVSLKIRNLVQTEKTEVVDMLVQGEWVLPITLPKNSESAVLNHESIMTLGHHEIAIERMEIGAFEVRMYGAEEELRHALRHQSTMVTGVRYLDGTVVEETSAIRIDALAKDESTGEYYIGVSLNQAIDISSFKELISEEKNDTAEASKAVMDDAAIEQMTVIYEKYDHAIVGDKKGIYLVDRECGVMRQLADLETLGYDEKDGGTIEAGPGGNYVSVLPNAESEVQFIIEASYEVDMAENIHEIKRNP